MGLLKKSIATTLLRVVFGLYLVVTVIVTISAMYIEYDHTADEISTEIRELQNTTKQSMAVALWTYNTESLDTIMHGLMGNPNVVGVRIKDGSEVYKLGMTLDDRGIPDTTGNGITDTKHLNESTLSRLVSQKFPIIYTDLDGTSRQLGEGEIYTSSQVVFDRVKYGFMLILFSAVIKTAALWLIFLYFIKKIIVTPLASLTEATDAIDLDNLREIEISRNYGRDDELATLGESYNKMIRKLISARDKLTQLNMELEERVEERTKDLQTEIERRKSAQHDAEQANQAKSRFLASMSHEIRTPMNGVLGMASILSNTELTEQQREYINIIKLSGTNLLNLLNDILDLSKVEAEAMVLEESRFNLPKLLSNVVMTFHESARKKGIDLNYEIADGLPDSLIADETRLSQVLINLINNAIKFTEQGGVQVSVESVYSAEDLLLRFKVSDTGIGINQEARSELFSAFTQVDSSTTRKYGGSGLGLAICKQLVTLMGGEIWLESQPGKGTTFYFTVNARIPDISRDDEEQKGVGMENGISHANKDIRILLVEDDAVNQMVALNLLEHIGYKAQASSNGKEALEVLRRDEFDLVLMDIQMPEMDGIEATRHIYEEWEKEKRPVIIALTASVVKEDLEQCMGVGMDDFISKPIDVEILQKKLAKWSRAISDTKHAAG